MIVMLSALALGFGLGAATGGRPANLASVELRRPLLVVGALAVQLSVGLFPAGLRPPVVVVCALAVVAWCVVNRGSRLLTGMVLVASGVTANMVVIAANGGMPVRLSALRGAGLSPTMDVSRGHFDKHVVMTARTHLRFLGDILPVPHLHTVVSPGDVAMLAGFALLGFVAMRATASAGSHRSVV
jgi:hypothetical protein